MSRPWLIPVGGFLGAGKTTLILSAARILSARGLKCAAIMNDQAGDLVDSAYATSQGITTNDVTGGCFCCRFSELMDKAAALRALSPDVIFIEPVGSCTDLSATILQPLKEHFSREYRLAPLTVVVDPTRDHSDLNIAFLFENQISEADIVLLNYRGTLSEPRIEKRDSAAASDSEFGVWVDATSQRHPFRLQTECHRSINALSGRGVAAWLDELFSGTLPTASKILTIDYATYAAAEAALGWLNYSATFHLSPALSPAAFIGPWLDRLQESIPQIVHLKVFDQTPVTYLKAAVTSNTDEPSIQGDLAASPEIEHAVRLNLRAIASPERLHMLFTQALAALPGRRADEYLQCFSPAAPQPEHRYAEIL